MKLHAARDLLERATRERVAPAAVAEVGRSDGPRWHAAAGSLTYDSNSPAATLDTIFDLASLTKVLSTTALAMRLLDAGRLDLGTPVRALIAGWRERDRASVTVHDLLAHAAGLPGVLPLYERCFGRTDFERAICDTPLAYAPRARSIYSDLGFILLGFILEDAGAATLRQQFEEMSGSLAGDGADWLDFGPVEDEGELARVAPTQVDAWRGGRLLRGEVDDRNGAALGGVAGHTGVFGTVAAVGRFAREVLRGELGRQNAVATPATIARFVERTAVPGSSRALGWDTMLPTSSCGSLMSPRAFGHTGFTGTSIWIDPAADVYAVLLTNRVYPAAGSAEPIRMLRRGFHDAVLEELQRNG